MISFFHSSVQLHFRSLLEIFGEAFFILFDATPELFKIHWTWYVLLKLKEYLVQGYRAHKKMPPRRNLQWNHA